MCIFTTPPGATRTAGTQPPICFTKKQSSNWGRGGGSKNLNKNLNKLLKKLPEQAKEEKNILCCARMKETKLLLSAAALGFHNSEWDGVYVTSKNSSLQMKV